MARQSAYILALSVVFLAVLGIVMLSSTGAYAPELPADDPYFAVRRQLCWLGVGFAACLIGALVDYGFWGRHWLLWYSIACILLGLCFIDGIGIHKNGASRWIGMAGFQFQPSEIARLAIIVSLAAWFARYRDEVQSWGRGFLYPLLLLGLPLGLITAEVDLGCATLVGCTTLLVMFVAGTRISGLVAIAVAGAAGLWALIQIVPDRMNRVLAFMNLDDPVIQLADGYQQWRGLLAFGSGGWAGLGLGASRQKMQFLPFAHTDFIMPIIGEELGLRVSLLVVVAFVVLIVCGLLIASQAPDSFGRLLGLGVVSLIGLQAAINLGVTTALLPNKGIPLPFISYGGSNLVCCLAGIGILFNIYRQGIATPGPTAATIARAKTTRRL